MAVENAMAGAFETPARYVEWTPVIAGAIAAAAVCDDYGCRTRRREICD